MSKAKKYVLVLRTCNPDMTSYGGFKWPAKGKVSDPDWRDDFACGGGLHGWLWGEGDGSLGNNSPDSKWLVVKVLESDIRHGQGEMVGKCKFPRGEVVFCGDRKGATDFIIANGASGKSVIGGTATAGDRGTATAGDSGTATAGDRGTATAGDNGTATAGYRGTATAGNGGTATAGNGGTATAGERGTATAGYNGTATAGDSGIICIRYYDYKTERYRMAVAYIGEDGIKPGVKYRLNDDNKFVEAV